MRAIVQLVKLPSNRFGLNFNPLEFTNNVVNTIEVACSMPIGVSFYKLNLYTTGGFFRSHKDTAKVTNHIGASVTSLPTDFEDDDISKISLVKKRVLIWVFFYSDIEHKILPVTNGHGI